MIEDSDIGPENSTITYRNLVNQIMNIIWRVFSRKTNWIMMLYIFMYFVFEGAKIAILDVSVDVLFLFICIGIYVVLEIFNFFRVKKIEKLWDRRNI
jgi:hypothetical protein